MAYLQSSEADNNATSANNATGVVEITTKDAYPTDICPILCMPDEVISIVFTKSIHSEREDRKPVSLTLKDITQVCRSWRRVALDLPILWGKTIDYVRERPKWTTTLLERSRCVPLDVRASLWPPNDGDEPRENVLSALQHVARIRSLTLVAVGSLLQEFCATLIGPAPILESLYLFNLDNTQNVPVPTLTIDVETPRLRCLLALNCDVALNSPLFRSNLTCLYLHRRPLPSETSLGPILDALENLSTLEALTLEYLFSDDQFESQDGRIIDLPHLHHLELSMDHVLHARFLDYLSLPSDIHLTLNAHVEPGETQIEGMLEAMTPKFGGLSGPQSIAALCISGPRRAVKISGWIRNYCLAGPSFVLMLLSTASPSAEDISVELTSLCESLPLSDLVQLSVTFDEPVDISRTTWLFFMQRMKYLRWVKIGRAPRGFLRALDPGPKSLDDPQLVLLPNLKRLSLYDTDFSYRSMEGGLKTSTLLINCLWNRWERKSWLIRMRIWRCVRLPTHRRNWLRSAVRVFQWDEGGADDSYGSEDWQTEEGEDTENDLGSTTDGTDSETESDFDSGEEDDGASDTHRAADAEWSNMDMEHRGNDDD